MQGFMLGKLAMSFKPVSVMLRGTFWTNGVTQDAIMVITEINSQ